jgi:hypothetical protein
MALFGWTTPQQAAVYTKKANRQVRSLGRAAARGTKQKQKCPTFSTGSIRWDN